MHSRGVRHVFVYGTLRRGEQRDINLMLPKPVWLGLARLPGLLYDLGNYPGMVLGQAGLVLGEVYRISADLERQLDVIEEVWPEPSGEYFKREVTLRLDGPSSCPAGHALQCLVYEVAPERLAGKRLIASGDWVQHRLNASL